MRTMRDKLIRLQKLYIEQFGRLQHKLRESRRTYLAQVHLAPLAKGLGWRCDHLSHLSLPVLASPFLSPPVPTFHLGR